ncbi:MAG TPA: lipid kinase [Salinisphaeraceae bacterium]|nr:lipid kinase [Salinisphaeraceae bacterium]
MRVLVLINPGARQGPAHADTAMKQLWAMGVDVVRARAEQLADWPALIERHAAHIDCVVVGGGDGSLNFALDAILRNKLTLGVLPLGTANDFARTLGYPDDPAAACRVVAQGVDHRVDVGRVNDAYFLNVASIGLAVRARSYRSAEAKRRFGALSYVHNAYAAFRDTRAFRVRVVCDGVRRDLHTIQLAIGNGRYFGGGLSVASNASLDDGRLDLFSLEPQTPAEMLRLLPTLLRGPDSSIRGGELLQGTHIRVITARPHAINTDGEVLTHTPALVRILPRALRVRVPQAYRAAFEARQQAERTDA